MRKIVAAAALSSALVFSGTVHAQGDPGKVAISISCGSVGIEFQVCRTGVEAWAKATGHRVQLVSTPNDSNERLALYQQLLAAKSGDIDVFQIDVVWPGILANHLIDLREHIDPKMLDQHFEAIVRNDIVDDRLVAMPWFTDAGLFYYRKDLLEKYGRPLPTTWQEMTETARIIQEGERAAGNDRMWGYVYQAKAYEGLTCNALEWVKSFGGGQIVEADGTISINNENAVKALETAQGWIGTISPGGVLSYQEEEARGVWQTGNAVFMRNWPYAYALSEGDDSAVQGKFDVAPLPTGGDGSAATLGGWNVAVSRYSTKQEAAISLALFLASVEGQKAGALMNGNLPTIPALYEDAEIAEKVPLIPRWKEVFEQAVPRPSAPVKGKYNEVSAKFWSAVHNTLSGNGTAAENLEILELDLDDIKGSDW